MNLLDKREQSFWFDICHEDPSGLVLLVVVVLKHCLEDRGATGEHETMNWNFTATANLKKCTVTN